MPTPCSTWLWKDDKLSASIAGVLCAHIRETTGNKGYQGQNKDKPSIEMQSLLKLLFTTETVDEGRLARFWEGLTPDLEGGYFHGVELDSARFQGTRLSSAQFKGARLTGARFQEAALDGAQFQRAWLRGAQFQGVWMRETRFHAAHLTGTRFQGADLGWAQFQGAQLFGSQFQGAWLYMAEFQQAQFGTEKYRSVSPQDAEDALGLQPERMEKSELQGISSTLPYASPSFEKRIKDRVDKKSDFSEVVFSGNVTEEMLAEVKEALEVPVASASWHFNTSDDPDFKKELIRNLESEIGQPKCNEPPKRSFPIRTARKTMSDTVMKTLSDGLRSSAKPWQKPRKPANPNSAADIAVTAGRPTHEGRQAAAFGADSVHLLGFPSGTWPLAGEAPFPARPPGPPGDRRHRFLGMSKASTTVRLPKPGPAAQASQAQAPLTWQSRGGQQSVFQLAPCLAARGFGPQSRDYGDLSPINRSMRKGVFPPS